MRNNRDFREETEQGSLADALAFGITATLTWAFQIIRRPFIKELFGEPVSRDWAH